MAVKNCSFMVSPFGWSCQLGMVVISTSKNAPHIACCIVPPVYYSRRPSLSLIILTVPSLPIAAIPQLLPCVLHLVLHAEACDHHRQSRLCQPVVKEAAGPIQLIQTRRHNVAVSNPNAAILYLHVSHSHSIRAQSIAAKFAP